MLDCRSRNPKETMVSAIVGGRNAHQAPLATAWKASAQCNWEPSDWVFAGPSPSMDREDSARIAPEICRTNAMTM
jgi:hypothetical protein